MPRQQEETTNVPHVHISWFIEYLAELPQEVAKRPGKMVPGGSDKVSMLVCSIQQGMPFLQKEHPVLMHTGWQ